MTLRPSQIETLDGQAALPVECCKVRDCPHPVVGSSTTGQGHVCKGHNEREWGEALRKYDPPLSAALLRDWERSLTPKGRAALEEAGE